MQVSNTMTDAELKVVADNAKRIAQQAEGITRQRAYREARAKSLAEFVEHIIDRITTERNLSKENQRNPQVSSHYFSSRHQQEDFAYKALMKALGKKYGIGYQVEHVPAKGLGSQGEIESWDKLIILLDPPPPEPPKQMDEEDKPLVRKLLSRIRKAPTA